VRVILTGDWRVGVVRMAALLVTLLAAALATPARAQTYSIQVSAMDFGVVNSAITGDTLYRADPTTGIVSMISGSGSRLSGGSARSLVTISCTAVAPTDCTKALKIHIGAAGSPTNRARALARMTFAMGTAVLSGSPGSPASGNFTIGQIGPNTSKTFFIGGDLGVAGDDSALPSGDSETGFVVQFAETPATPTSGGSGVARVRVIRSITVAKTADMVFGAIVKPAVGTGTVSIDAGTGLRTVTGGEAVLNPSPSPARFTVGGEGGQTFTLGIPSTFEMTGPGAPLTVTTNNSATPSPILGSSLGSQGSYLFAVGGSFAIGATMVSGDYAGTLTVTVAYN